MSKLAHILAVQDNQFKDTKYLPINAFIDLDPRTIHIACRELLEGTSHYKQVIPYVMVTQDDKFLAYTRKSSSGESRLHNNISIGFGGHIDFEDIVATNDSVISVPLSIEVAASRELLEEIGLDIDISHKWIIGTINDNSNPVGQVHVGAVIKVESDWDLDNYTVEEHIELLGYKSLDELKAYGDQLENWSKIVVDNLNNSTVE